MRALLYCWMFSRIPGICPLGASNTFPVVIAKNVSRHCQISLEYKITSSWEPLTSSYKQWLKKKIANHWNDTSHKYYTVFPYKILIIALHVCMCFLHFIYKFTGRVIKLLLMCQRQLICQCSFFLGGTSVLLQERLAAFSDIQLSWNFSCHTKNSHCLTNLIKPISWSCVFVINYT